MKRLFPYTMLLLLFLASSCSHSRPPVEEKIKSQTDRREIALGSKMMHRPKIVIDAGHGGKDLGAESKTDPNYQEKALNLSTALMLDKYLQKMGYHTILTRGDDSFIPLQLRAALANGNHATLFVSVHYNSAKSPKAEGVEVYYYHSAEDVVRSNSSKRLAKNVLNQIVTNVPCKSRGIKEGNFAVIRETTMPAILVEGGFVTNAKELANLSDPIYQQTLAGSIALGIHQYLKSLE